MRKDLIKPRRLQPGDTIGVVAPASPFDMAEFEKGIHAIEAMGFRAAVPEELFEKSGYLAGSDTHRAALVRRLFADAAVSAIVCARGGYGSLRILSLLDYTAIRRRPKAFVGFSDITALLHVLSIRAGLVTFHGPMITTLADSGNGGLAAFQTAVSEDRPPVIRADTGPVLAAGRASGRVAGGNLTTLCHLLGTPYTPFFGGCILFLEDVGEAPYRIDRMLTQMTIAGCFHGVAGVVLGDFKDCGETGDVHTIVGNAFRAAKVPILAGVPAGHGGRNHTLPIGLPATLDTGARELRYHEAATDL